MKITFFINRLNHHQAPVADEMFHLIGDSFRFVETCAPNDQSKKGSNEDYSTRAYLVKAWKDDNSRNEAMSLALESDVAVFGAESFDYEVYRTRNSDKLSFELSERWLKRGFISFFSPRLLKSQWYYHTLFYKKPLYKLCASAYAANDHYLMRSFVNKCYKWGYFTKQIETSPEVYSSNVSRILWCGRFLKLKHPELPIKLAERLKKKKKVFVLDMIGTGPVFDSMQKLAKDFHVDDVINFLGFIPNDQVLEEMKRHDIFLFTSDRNEGWGAVANEAMGCGCVLVASDAIGSSPYLIQQHQTGCMFRSNDLDSLENEVLWLMDNKEKMHQIQAQSRQYINEIWNPHHAAESLLQLINDLKQGRLCSITDGPCSKAIPYHSSKS